MSENKVIFSEDDMVQMLDETSSLLGEYSVSRLTEVLIAAKKSSILTNDVEFWQWMQRNYSPSGIFDSTTSMKQYIEQSLGKENWMIKQLQGKGYEWDWMTSQRNNPANFFNTYDAGDVANRVASDVTERSILTGKSAEYQLKAYISKSNPDLHNTPKDMTVVTNVEKVDKVAGNGYKDVECFQDAPTIKKRTQDRLEQIRKGKANPAYTVKNVTGTMMKSGLIGCAFGMGTESIESYKLWQNGRLTDDEYVAEILKAGGESGVTSSVTAGIMIPVSAMITAMGASNLLTIPMAFIVSNAVNKVVAPFFGRGDYKKFDEEKQREQIEAFNAMMKEYAEERRREEVKQLISLKTEKAFDDAVVHIIQSGEIQRLIGITKTYKEEHDEMVACTAKRVLVALCLKEYQEQLQRCVDTYFAELSQYINTTLDALNDAVKNENYDDIVKACNQIRRIFSQESETESLEDIKRKLFSKKKILF